MRKSQKIALLSVSIAAVLVAGGGGLVACSSDTGGGPRSASGPLLIRPAHGWSASVEVGNTFVDGSEQLFTTRGEASLVKVEIEGDSEIALVGSGVAGATRDIATVQYLDDWPVTGPEFGPIAPTEGVVIGTRQLDAMGTELFVAMKLEKPGHFLRKGIWVTYTAGGDTYRDFIEAELTVCSPEFLVDGECPFLGRGAD